MNFLIWARAKLINIDLNTLLIKNKTYALNGAKKSISPGEAFTVICVYKTAMPGRHIALVLHEQVS